MENTSFLTLLIALQFAAFGWRINREISLGDKIRKTWLPIVDILNIVSMLVVVVICIILPLIGLSFTKLIKITISEAYILIIFHLINMSAHYRLFSKKGRYMYIQENKDFPYITDQEYFTYILTLISMIIVFLLMI